MEALDAVLAAHRAYLLGWNIGAPGGPDLPTYRSDVPHASLNGVLRVAGRTPQAALAEARHRLDGVPRVWWVGPDSDAGTADGLVSLGAVEVTRLPIMTVAIGAAAGAPTPAGLHIAETTDLDAFVRAYARVSGIPAEGVAATIDREKAFIGDGTVIRLAGHLDDGRIVGTAMAWFSHGLLTLYFVGTQPEQRRQGICAAMTRAALDVAAERGVRTGGTHLDPRRRVGLPPPRLPYRGHVPAADLLSRAGVARAHRVPLPPAVRADPRTLPVITAALAARRNRSPLL